ncbi:MAG: enoyl-CoA hydratase [Actinobacteria bacterium]|nr:enoyl-CoA hydratase [Actinomycetota bacterium]NIS36077.1 enoyl-CoA hydratase [Actinomycetota bacterium]NIT98518.1 enoyl-CoA hydratase [Actinomycetota bacterium]NIU22134.1 enoyl-CoA hydratase [Actinomycetota bacterium]NIU70652.1 enoyl-CoA hydratase [Actinomycetota bacterium]
MTDEGLRFHFDGPVERITLSDPERRNALGLERVQALTAHLLAIDASASSSVVVIDAEGPAFSAGHDLGELCGIDFPAAQALFDASGELMDTIHSIRQPVIAAVDGVATAAGCQLVAACDLVVATERSTFATPGVQIGLFCSTPMVPLSRAVGRKRAMEMLLTGDPIPARTAAEWGLVNTVVPDGELTAAVDSLVGRIVRWSSHTIALGKSAFYEQLDRPEPEAYDIAKIVMSENAVDAVAQEGMRAFLDKREPDWPDP